MNTNKMCIILLIILVIIFLVPKSRLEHLTQDEIKKLNYEALNNLASINDKNLMNVTNLNATNSITTPKITISNDGKNVAFNLLPKGIIVAWHGTINNIPKGWALCDGTNGTPNLRGKFILGYNSFSKYNWKSSGGSERVTLTEAQMPKHKHSNSSKYLLGSTAVGLVMT